MCPKDGGIVDDLLCLQVCRSFMLVINASNIEKDFKWMEENKFGDVELKNISDEISLLAVQGKTHFPHCRSSQMPICQK